MTRLAFGLDQWKNRDYSGTAPLTEAALRLEADTFANARLWDYRPLRRTLDQLQTVRQYYDFVDVDTDRYMVDGELRQVMLSGRELAIERNTQATGWVNQRDHLHPRHRHGHGPGERGHARGPAAPLDQGPAAGLGGRGAPEITQPRIYFGETDDHYVVVAGAPGGVRLPAASRERPPSTRPPAGRAPPASRSTRRSPGSCSRCGSGTSTS